MTMVVNLFGGPGCGKSTAAAGLFAELKARGRNVEMAHEYAKDLCWEQNPRIEHQLSVFAEQCWRIQRLDGKVEFVITDSPILLSLIYGTYDDSSGFRALVREEHYRMPSFNIYVKRVKPYNPAGRYQDEAGAQALDDEIGQMLFRFVGGLNYCTVPGDRGAALYIANLLTEES